MMPLDMQTPLLRQYAVLAQQAEWVAELLHETSVDVDPSGK